MSSPRSPVCAYIGLGANLGDAAKAVLSAIDDISRLTGTELVRRSSLYRTMPIDSSGPDYINAVVEILTALSAPALLDQLQNLERLAGRERPYFNAPRTLDLDLLTYGEGQIHSPRLTVPHPRMQHRAFVLQPWAEIAPYRVDAAWLISVRDQKVQCIS